MKPDENTAWADTVSDNIEKAYRLSGNNLGWRFLYSPTHVLNDAEVALIGLNPGGNSAPAEHAEFSMSTGSAYADESWAGHWKGTSPLQRQVLGLFNHLGVEPENVLAGNLVPFRAPDWKSLKNSRSSLSFGIKIWREALARAKPKLIITMGTEATRGISKALGIQASQRIPVGWGSISAYLGTSADIRLVGLPHLSRFRIIDRPESQMALRELFGSYWTK